MDITLEQILQLMIPFERVKVMAGRAYYCNTAFGFLNGDRYKILIKRKVWRMYSLPTEPTDDGSSSITIISVKGDKNVNSRKCIKRS